VLRLAQQREELLGHLLHADHQAQRLRGRVRLHAIDRGREAHRRLAGGVDEDIHHAARAGLQVENEILERPLDRRHARGGDQHLAVLVDQRHARHRRQRDIGIDLGRLGRREPVALRRHRQEIAQIVGLERRLAAVVAAAAIVAAVLLLRAAHQELGHVELQGGVVGEARDIVELARDPALDIGLAAVGDDAEPRLPGEQILLALILHEAQDQENTDGRDRRQHDQTDRKGHARLAALPGGSFFDV
jgi:hypothetical protein